MYSAGDRVKLRADWSKRGEIYMGAWFGSKGVFGVKWDGENVVREYYDHELERM